MSIFGGPGVCEREAVDAAAAAAARKQINAPRSNINSIIETKRVVRNGGVEGRG